MNMGFPGGSVVKNPPAKQETQVRSLGWKEPLEKEMAIRSSILAWKIPDRGAQHVQSMGHKRVEHDLGTKQRVFNVIKGKFLSIIIEDI